MVLLQGCFFHLISFFTSSYAREGAQSAVLWAGRNTLSREWTLVSRHDLSAQRRGFGRARRGISKHACNMVWFNCTGTSKVLFRKGCYFIRLWEKWTFVTEGLRWGWFSTSCNYHLNTEVLLVSLNCVMQVQAVVWKNSLLMVWYWNQGIYSLKLAIYILCGCYSSCCI